MWFLLLLEKIFDMDQSISDYIQSKRAIIVEDEASIANLLKIHLTEAGFTVQVAASAEAAIRTLETHKFDLCLLDWMLPEMQGVDFLKKIKPHHPSLKVMMVTARVDQDSIVMGLDGGADDYLPKPFDSKVLLARVRNLMRRLQAEEKFNGSAQKNKIDSAADLLGFDGLVLDPIKHIVTLNQNEIHLTPSEFKLLTALLASKGAVLTREKLIDLIQGESINVTGRTIDTHICSLRKKIEPWSKYIETIRGVGYRTLSSSEDLSEEGM